MLNLSATVGSDDGQWQLKGFAQNLSDKQYFTDSFTGDLGAGVRHHLGWPGEPRMYGVSFTYNFQ